VRRADYLVAFVGALAAACGSNASPGTGVGSLSTSERAALAKLSPSSLPAPPTDISNRFADDPQAATLGQKLFFEPIFSGRLLDGDNDGSANALGARGETGKVACVGCHIAAAGFLDNRTLGEQISLGAGWGRRRAPSLLDVGQAKLLMWDGRHDALYNQPFGPLESPVEMNSSRLYAAEQLYAQYRGDYEAIFGPMPPLADVARFPKLSAEVTGCTPSTVDPVPTCNGTKHGLPGDGAEFDELRRGFRPRKPAPAGIPNIVDYIALPEIRPDSADDDRGCKPDEFVDRHTKNHEPGSGCDSVDSPWRSLPAVD